MDASTQLFIICLEREEEQSLFDLAAAIGYPAAEIVVGTMGQALSILAVAARRFLQIWMSWL